MQAPTLDELRRVRMFADLADDELAWIAERCDTIDLAAGAVLFEVGAPADAMYLTLAGTVEARRPSAPGAPPFVFATGEAFGPVPFSRMVTYAGTARAVGPTRVARFPRTEFDALLRRIPALEPKFVALLTDRVRETTRRDDQQEKMGALGRLAAGLAHELNNPASAARRAASEARRRAGEAADAAARAAAHADARIGEVPNVLDALAEVRRRASHAPATSEEDALDRADRQDALADWIRDVAPDADADGLAGDLADTGVTADDLAPALDPAPESVRRAALDWLAASLALDANLRVVESATGRISALVSAIKTYTHMDRGNAPEAVDVRDGLNCAILLLGHRLRDRRVALVRDLPDGLPRILGRTGELNQVWTNLVDNAIDAAADRGADGAQVTVRSRRDGDAIAVDVADNGAGIPADVRDRIWEPFFTTKEVGRGTGLGLDIVRRIVLEHRGTIDFDTAPGATRFTVRLPIA